MASISTLRFLDVEAGTAPELLYAKIDAAAKLIGGVARQGEVIENIIRNK